MILTLFKTYFLEHGSYFLAKKFVFAKKIILLTIRRMYMYVCIHMYTYVSHVEERMESRISIMIVLVVIHVINKLSITENHIMRDKYDWILKIFFTKIFFLCDQRNWKWRGKTVLFEDGVSFVLLFAVAVNILSKWVAFSTCIASSTSSLCALMNLLFRITNFLN